MAPSILLRRFFGHTRAAPSPSPESSASSGSSGARSLTSYKGHQHMPVDLLRSASCGKDTQQTDLDDFLPDAFNSLSPNYCSSKPASNFSPLNPPKLQSTNETSPNASSAAGNKKKKSSFLPSFRDRRASSSDKPGNITSQRNSGTPQFEMSPSKTSKSDVNRAPREPRIGDVVYFGELKGIIRYIGTTHFAPAAFVYCGLELYTPSGKNDGAVEGVRYFQCPAKFGLFVSLDRVTFKPSKDTVPSRVSKGYQNIPNPSLINDLTEVKRKTSSLRDHASNFGSSYVRNDTSQQVVNIDGKSFSNGSLNTNVYAPSSMKSPRNAPKTPPSAIRKVFLQSQPQFLRTQSVPKLTNSEVNSSPPADAISNLATENSHTELSNITTNQAKPSDQSVSGSSVGKFERFLRPKGPRGNVSKLSGDGNRSQRNSLTESSLPKSGMSDMTLLIRDKQLQSGIPSTPLGDGSPGSALRQAQYLFTCPSPTPDQVLADMDFEVATETYVIESEDNYEAQAQLGNSPGPNATGVLPRESNIDADSQRNPFINQVSSDENSSDKTENFLETIPEAENSMANTLDRLADRRSLNSEDSFCGIPSKRTSPDGSCDNSIDINYGNRLILAQPIKLKPLNIHISLDDDRHSLRGSKETISGDEKEDQSEIREDDDLTNECNNFDNVSPHLPRSLTSSCAVLCDQDEEFENEEGLEIDEILLADESYVFSNQSEFSADEDEEDDYCVLKEGAGKTEGVYIEGKEKLSPKEASLVRLKTSATGKNSPCHTKEELDYVSLKSEDIIDYEVVEETYFGVNEREKSLEELKCPKQSECTPDEDLTRYKEDDTEFDIPYNLRGKAIRDVPNRGTKEVGDVLSVNRDADGSTAHSRDSSKQDVGNVGKERKIGRKVGGNTQSNVKDCSNTKHSVAKQNDSRITKSGEEKTVANTTYISSLSNNAKSPIALHSSPAIPRSANSRQHQKSGIAAPKQGILNRELPPLPRQSSNNHNIPGCGNKLGNNEAESKATTTHDEKELSPGGIAIRYSEVELPNPSLIFGPDDDFESAPCANSHANPHGGKLNLKVARLSSNYQLSEDEKSSNSQIAIGGKSSPELQDTDDEILKNDPAIVRSPVKKSSLPVVASNFDPKRNSKPKTSSTSIPVLLVKSQPSAAKDENPVEKESQMVINSTGPKTGVSGNGNGGLRRKGQVNQSNGPPPLPERNLKTAPQKSQSTSELKKDQKLLNQKQHVSSKPLQSGLTKSSAQNSLGADVKASKLAPPKQLPAQIQQQVKGAKGKQTTSDVKLAAAKKAADPKQSESDKVSKGKPTIASNTLAQTCDPSDDLENKSDHLSAIDVDLLSNSHRTLSCSSLSSVKSADKVSSSKKTSTSKPPVVANFAQNDRRPSAPLVSRLLPSPVPPSPLLPRKKKPSTTNQSKLVPQKPNSATQAVKGQSALEEKQKEVSSLTAELEEKCALLEKSSVALRSSNKAVDVFSVLVQHLTQSVDAFSVPDLKSQIKSLQSALQNSQKSLDAANSDIRQLKVQHDEQIQELLADHSAKMQQLKEQLDQEYEERLEQVKCAHEEEKDFILDENEQQLAELRVSHQSELEEIVANRDSMLDSVERRHRSAIESLNDQYTQDITSTQRISSQTIQKLRDQVNDLENRNEDLIRKLRELEKYIEQNGDQWKKGFFEPEADGRPRTKSVPDTNVSVESMPQELESLRCVLEMRDEEIHRLRREMNDANVLRETLLTKEEELSSCRLQVESLRASLEMKSDMEKELRSRCNEQAFRLAEEKKRKKQLAIDNEKLSFQMKDMEVMVQSLLDQDNQEPKANESSLNSRASSLPTHSKRPGSLYAYSRMNQTFTGPISSSPQASPTSSLSRDTSSPSHTFSSRGNSNRDTPDEIAEEELDSHGKPDSATGVKAGSSGSSENSDSGSGHRKTKRQKSLAFTVPF